MMPWLPHTSIKTTCKATSLYEHRKVFAMHEILKVQTILKSVVIRSSVLGGGPAINIWGEGCEGYCP